MDQQTISCPICGEPYVFYVYYAGDQSACPECRAKARKKNNATTSKDYKWKGEMKSMNDMSMKELLETERKINNRFFEEANFLRKKTVDPPEWARELDDDEKFQREMGAQAIWIECAYCGVWTKSVSSFCGGTTCKLDYIELQKQEKERIKTKEMMGVK